MKDCSYDDSDGQKATALQVIIPLSAVCAFYLFKKWQVMHGSQPLWMTKSCERAVNRIPLKALIPYTDYLGHKIRDAV